MNNYILGIDYGLEGACAVVRNGSLLCVEGLYLRSRNMPNTVVAAQELRGAVAYVEDFQLRWANKPAREAAIRYGELLMFLRLNGATVHRIAATAWKKALGLKAVKDYKARKALSLKMARELFPGTAFSSADHAEAALIAEYGRRCQA